MFSLVLSASLLSLACSGVHSSSRAEPPRTQDIWHAQVSMLRDGTEPPLSFVEGEMFYFLPGTPPDAEVRLAFQSDPSSLPWGYERALQFSCSGWGDSVEAAERNALARMQSIQDAKSRVFTYWLSRQPEAQYTSHPLFLLDLIDEGAGEQELIATVGAVISTIIGTRPFLSILASSEARAVMMQGPHQVRYTPSEQLGRQCGQDLPTHTLSAAVRSGAAYDTAVTQLCSTFSAMEETRMHSARSHSSEEGARVLLTHGLMVRDICWLDCLQNAVIESLPASP